MKVSIPLRIIIPATLFLFGVLVGALSLTYEVTSSFRRIEDDVNRRAVFLGNHVSGMLEYHFRQGDTNAAQLQLKLLGGNPNLRLAVVCDAENKVILSTRGNLADKGLADTPLRGAQQAVEFSRSQMKAESTFTRDRNLLSAAFPFRIFSLETDRWITAVLYLEYDLALLKDSEWSDAMRRSSIGIAVLGFLCLLVSFFFNRILTRRIMKLVSAAQHLARGEFTPINLKGSDEIAELSQAFDGMGENIRARTVELEEANKKMKREIAERELAENRFLSVWKSSVDGMRLTDQHGNIVAVNEAYGRMVGLSVEELDGKPFTICYKSEDGSEMLETYRQRFANRSIETFIERQVKFRSEKKADLEISSSFIAQDNDEPLLLSVFRDVTERKRAEELLNQQAASMEASMDGMAILDHEGHYIYLNDAHARIYGYECSDELIGKTWEFLYERDEFCRLKEHVMPLLFRTGRWRGEAIGKKRDGTTFPQEISLSRIETGGLVCVVRDVTERKQEEDRRISIERKLLDAQKLESLGVLAGGIAHDFNNLLTAILGNASLALMQTSPVSPQRTYLEHIEKTSMQAADLCKQMLAYSGRGKFVTQKLDLNALIRDMEHFLQISINKGVYLNFNLANALPAIEADSAQIRQVMMNLVINASEAIGHRDGMVSITTGEVRVDRGYLASAYMAPDLAEGNYVFVEVSDTGCGMSAETLKKIFEPFFTTKFTGRGLGLAAVLGIVRGHKGAIKVQSELNRGTTFKVLVPCTDSPADNLYRDPPTQSAWQGQGTILVVDDEETVRLVTCEILKMLGFEVLTANDGRQGVEQFEKNKDIIAAVILDMTMPHMNGEEAFREMRRIRGDIKIILVSGYNEQDATNRFAGKGLSGFLQKPFKVEDLRNKLRSVLEK